MRPNTTGTIKLRRYLVVFMVQLNIVIKQPSGQVAERDYATAGSYIQVQNAVHLSHLRLE